MTNLITSTFLLYKYIGAATFVGLSTMIVFIPLNTFFARLSKKIRKKKYEIQDSRIKMMNEILSGIRVIKFYGWVSKNIIFLIELNIIN